jgi:chromosomal replication initiation ATPase DnaA
MAETILNTNDLTPRKLTHLQGRMEQRLYWGSKSMPERLAAMTALTRRMYLMRGIDIDERKTDFTVSRVRRRKS